MEPALRLTGLTKRYGDQTALDGIDLTIARGAFCVLLGPSGCGKSTLLRLLAGLERPCAGRIHLGATCVADGATGALVPPGRRDLGMVFQGYALWPHKTVADNIGWPLEVAGLGRNDRRARVGAVASMLEIEPYLARYPAALSGGQQQRVAIARCIAPRPSLLLFDEPLSNLDAQLRVEMRSELLRVHRETGATVVYVTHDQVEALTMASRIVVMNRGRIEQSGAPREILAAPRTAFVAGFLGNPPANLVTADPLPAWHVDGVPLKAPPVRDGLAVEAAPLRLMVRPERVVLHREPGRHRLPGRFIEALPLGGGQLVGVTGPFGRITAIVPDWPAGRYGDPVHVELPPEPDAVFTRNGERIA